MVSFDHCDTNIQMHAHTYSRNGHYKFWFVAHFFYSSSLCYFRFFVVTIVVVVVADFLFVLRVSYAKRERERERSMWIYFCVERAFDVSFMYT